MKRIFIYALTAAMLAGAPAYAADSNTIAVVNIQQIMRESSVTKSVHEQLENKYKAFQADISKREEQLQKEDQELGKQKGVLAKEAFEAKAVDFRKKVTEAQKEAQSKKAVLDSASARSWEEIQKTVLAIIADLAKEKGFMVALSTESPASQVLYADSSLDISAEVLKRLNAKLPKLDVKFEAPAKPAKK
jgi:outer membrane protein